MKYTCLLALFAMGMVGCCTQMPQGNENQKSTPKYNPDLAKQKTLLQGKR